MRCLKPPSGWWCSRDAGHDGPCAARPDLFGDVWRRLWLQIRQETEHVSVAFPVWAQEILSDPHASKEDIERAHNAAIVMADPGHASKTVGLDHNIDIGYGIRVKKHAPEESRPAGYVVEIHFYDKDKAVEYASQLIRAAYQGCLQ